MAAFKCDICGGNLVMQKGGKIAICESCGTRHDERRVKEKIKEIKGTVKIEGAVEVVEGESSLNKLVANAKTFFELEEYEKLEETADKLISSFPNDYNGWLYKWYLEIRGFSVSSTVSDYMKIKTKYLDSAYKFLNGNNIDSFVGDILNKVNERLKNGFSVKHMTFPYDEASKYMWSLLETDHTLDDFLQSGKEFYKEHLKEYISKIVENIKAGEISDKDCLFNRDLFDYLSSLKYNLLFLDEELSFFAKGISNATELRRLNTFELEYIDKYVDPSLLSVMKENYVCFIAGKTIIYIPYKYDNYDSDQKRSAEHGVSSLPLEYIKINYDLGNRDILDVILEIKNDLKESYKKQNGCSYCGGKFNFLNVCKSCGKKKNY